MLQPTTYQGTIIVQGFDHSKFMGGVTGWLRQEFRELELLDEITRIKYEGKLPSTVQGATRVALIHSYRTYKGTKYVPKTVHGALKWSDHDPFALEEPYKEAEWELVKHTKDKKPAKKQSGDPELDAHAEPTVTQRELLEAKYVPAKGSTQLTMLSTDAGGRTKRKHTGESAEDSERYKKQAKTGASSSSINHRGHEPTCFTWNEATYSCAFDTLFGIMHHVYQSQSIHWATHIRMQNPILALFTELLGKVEKTEMALDTVRDQMHERLHNIDPGSFPIVPPHGSDIYALCRHVLASSSNILQRIDRCSSCHVIHHETQLNTMLWELNLQLWNHRIGYGRAPKNYGSVAQSLSQAQAVKQMSILPCYYDTRIQSS